MGNGQQLKTKGQRPGNRQQATGNRQRATGNGQRPVFLLSVFKTGLKFPTFVKKQGRVVDRGLVSNAVGPGSNPSQNFLLKITLKNFEVFDPCSKMCCLLPGLLAFAQHVKFHVLSMLPVARCPLPVARCPVHFEVFA